MKYEKLIYAICFIAFILVIIFVPYFLCDINRKHDELEQSIASINTKSTTNTSDSEYEKTIEFLKEETIKFRSFVEQQHQFLTWLIALIGSVLSGVLVYSGFKSKKDIDKMINDNYEKIIKERLIDFIGGQIRYDYLKQCIKKDYDAKNKKILFLVQGKENNSHLKHLAEYLSDEGYIVDIQKKKNNRNRTWDKLKQYHIIIYEVSDCEVANDRAEANNTDEIFYIQLAKWSNTNKIYSIHYYNGNNLDREYVPKDYSVVANSYLTILERLNNLLYFAPDELYCDLFIDEL